ncbi:Flp pilus assembly protein TadG [Novosphingobium barchaimii LL02]|uniref:Flp pilus assembly protein TadG n=2 Tax=Novosphingobium barchaimii TaxID=1420591 RepID=A0A0J7Y793_9SPHN|nr:Flp pilus assembly protein TadG [Novosphingobium barchaimii LL02]
MGQAPKIKMRPVQQLIRDTAGNVLPIAAIGLLVGIVIIGSAVDLSRNYLAKEQLQTACDAGVLAGRRTVTTNGWDTASQNAAKAYFNTNYNDNAQTTRLTTFNPVSSDDGNTITATATTVLDTLLMRVVGKDTITVTVTCGSSMGVGNADIMMVLDTTGSMANSLSGGQTRIQALRAAVKNFYQTMSAATGASNARVRYGFVPFSSTVNVGRLINDLDPRYLVDSRQYQSRVWEPGTTADKDTNTDWKLYSSKAYSSSSKCSSDLPSTTNFTDVSGQSKQQRTEYSCRDSGYYYYIYSRITTRPYAFNYRAATYDTSAYKNFNKVTTRTGDGGTNVSSTWAGCIEERSTIAQANFSYSSATGITPTGALDLNLDGIPSSDDKTKWAPMWPEVGYYRYTSSNRYTTSNSLYGAKTALYCPVESRLLSTMDKDGFAKVADSLTPIGGTYLDIGMIWGGRLLSPQGLWRGLVNDDPDNGGEVARHLIFMTDGEMEPNAYIQQAWGMEYWDRRVTSDGTTSDEARHTARFRAVCEAIKDKGIRIWVVAFTSALSDDLKACASDSSSYVAGNAAELNSAFQEIAKQVGELRVVE